MAAGIPVVCYDGGANSDAVSTKVIFDYAYNGQLTGEWAVNYIQTALADKETVKVALLDFPASPVVCVPMADNFQACVEALPNVEVVARQDGKANRTESMAVAENILTANPDIDIFYGIPSCVPSTSRRLETAGAEIELPSGQVLSGVRRVNAEVISILGIDCEQFKQMYYEKENILEVTATTVQPLSEKLKQKLIEKLGSVSGKSIILHEKLDRAILGGIVLRYGNTEIDSSVRTKLDKIKSQIDAIIV